LGGYGGDLEEGGRISKIENEEKTEGREGTREVRANTAIPIPIPCS
jgi:hypothetical protein